VTGRSQLQVSVFTDREAAAKWLGVPVGLLTPQDLAGPSVKLAALQAEELRSRPRYEFTVSVGFLIVLTNSPRYAVFHWASRLAGSLVSAEVALQPREKSLLAV